MSPEVRAIFYGLAILFLALYTVDWRPKLRFRNVNFLALGLICFIFPFFYQAFDAA